MAGGGEEEDGIGIAVHGCYSRWTRLAEDIEAIAMTWLRWPEELQQRRSGMTQVTLDLKKKTRATMY